MEALIFTLASITAFVAIVALALLIAPRTTLQAIHRKPPKTNRMTAPKYRIERFFYRNHRWFGAIMVIGGFYTLFRLSFGLDLPGVQAAVGRLFTAPEMGAWLVESGVLYLWVSNLFVLILGVIVILRPSLLKGFESWSNTPVSELAPIAQTRSVFEDWIHRHPRQAGLFLIGGITYIVTMFTFYLKL